MFLFQGLTTGGGGGLVATTARVVSFICFSSSLELLPFSTDSSSPFPSVMSIFRLDSSLSVANVLSRSILGCTSIVCEESTSLMLNHVLNLNSHC